MTTQLNVHPTSELDVDDINLNDWNPNFVPSDIQDAIRDDIRQNGFLGSIIVQKHNERMNKDYVIINGEHRFKVFKDMGGKQIPSVIIDVSDETAKILTIRLNREHGELLPNKVGDILYAIQTARQADVRVLQAMTFIKSKDLEALINLRKADLAEIISAPKIATYENTSKLIRCPNCGNEFGISKA